MKENHDALWNRLKARSKTVELGMDSFERKRTGSYYTDFDLTDIMMQELVQNLIAQKKNICECRFLEPCAGTGNFVFSYLKEISKLNFGKEDYKKLLNNLYVADINKNALSEYSKLLKEFAKIYWDIDLEDSYFDEHIGSGLLIDVSADELRYLDCAKVFSSEVSNKKFDIVVTNPPYKNLKAERNHYAANDEYHIDKEKYASISKIAAKHFQYSTDGVLNLYKLFVEEIIDKYGNDTAFISLLIPASILSDKTCQKLRTHILSDACLLSVKVIEEGSGYIDAQQALCSILIQKGCKTETISMTKDFCHAPNESISIQIEDILNKNTGNAIIAVNKMEYPILKKLRTFPVVKDLPFIKNLRGELDLTTNKDAITKINTGYPLIRGRNIGYYDRIDTKEPEFVTLDFVHTTKKQCYIKEDRIICQQIANLHKERRITFAFAPKNSVLGNSCNFIFVEKNEYGIDIYTLLGLFNTKIINWLFKLTSSNNHINNYEIDAFPIPIGSYALEQIAILAKEYLKTKEKELLEKIEKYAEIAYGITEESDRKDETLLQEFFNDIRFLLPNLTLEDAKNLLDEKKEISSYLQNADHFTINVAMGITQKYRKIKKGIVLNHTTFKLSDFDLEIIKAVPPGGNWKDIPMETIQKSKRLKRITETGGRTTLYGRMDYDKPSYTITTYFNRPGNGTYVHPVHERVLSVREAARFQCFPDDYYFLEIKHNC